MVNAIVDSFCNLSNVYYEIKNENFQKKTCLIQLFQMSNIIM